MSIYRGVGGSVDATNNALVADLAAQIQPQVISGTP